jgi:AraC family transcriptional regulator
VSEIRSINGGKLHGVKTSIFTIMNQEKYDPKAIPAAWQDFFSKLPSTGLPNSGLFYGATIPSNDINVPMTYIAGTFLHSSQMAPESFDSVEVPSGNYFCFLHRGPMTDLAKSYGLAYGVELPQSGHQMRNAPHLEIYEYSKDPMSPDYEMTIAIPIS